MGNAQTVLKWANCCAARKPLVTYKEGVPTKRESSSPKSTIPGAPDGLHGADGQPGPLWLPRLPRALPLARKSRCASSDREFRFLAACRRGDLNAAKHFVDRGVRLDVEDKDGAQSMHWACYSGQLQMIEWLHGRGVALDVQTKYGSQPIHWASYNGQIDAVKWLFNHGIALDIEDTFGQQPVHWANRTGQLATARWLHEAFTKTREFKAASHERHMGPPPGRPPLSLMRWVDGEGSTLGQRWEAVPGDHAPNTGKAIRNAALAASLLHGKTRYTSSEFAQFDIKDLTASDFISTGSKYYRPVEV